MPLTAELTIQTLRTNIVSVLKSVNDFLTSDLTDLRIPILNFKNSIFYFFTNKTTIRSKV